jgi:hypothetical protein
MNMPETGTLFVAGDVALVVTGDVADFKVEYDPEHGAWTLTRKDAP